MVTLYFIKTQHQMIQTKHQNIQKIIVNSQIDKSRVADHKSFLKLICIENQSINIKKPFFIAESQSLTPDVRSIKKYKNNLNPERNPFHREEIQIHKVSSQQKYRLKQSLKLPSIEKRSTKNTILSRQYSEQQRLFPKYKFGSEVAQSRTGKRSQGSQASSNSPHKLNLSEQASRHLDFLNQFEKAVVHSRMSNGGHSSIFNKK